jgi:hypothetical protein
MSGGYVAITDNADPMNVVVYRRAVRLHGRRRVVCQKPVFGKGASATENSLITARRALFVENNNYAGIALGKSGTAYLGVLGGIVALRDG